MLFKSTIDLDTNNRETLERITNKMLNCNKVFHIHIKESKCKGFHIILKCKVKCSICRLVFDDSRRFYYDQYRPEFARDILFDRDELIEMKGKE